MWKTPYFNFLYISFSLFWHPMKYFNVENFQIYSKNTNLSLKLHQMNITNGSQYSSTLWVTLCDKAHTLSWKLWTNCLKLAHFVNSYRTLTIPSEKFHNSMHTMYNKRARLSAHQSVRFVVGNVKMGAVDTTTRASFDASCLDIYTLPSVTLRNSLFPNLMPHLHSSTPFRAQSCASYPDVYTLPSAILCLISRRLHPSQRNLMPNFQTSTPFRVQSYA